MTLCGVHQYKPFPLLPRPLSFQKWTWPEVRRTQGHYVSSGNLRTYAKVRVQSRGGKKLHFLGLLDTGEQITVTPQSLTQGWGGNIILSGLRPPTPGLFSRPKYGWIPLGHPHYYGFYCLIHHWYFLYQPVLAFTPNLWSDFLKVGYFSGVYVRSSPTKLPAPRTTVFQTQCQKPREA